MFHDVTERGPKFGWQIASAPALDTLVLMDTGVLPPDSRIRMLGDLALFLRGSDDSFTGDLLRLIARADPGNRSLLRGAFPEAVEAYAAWHSCTETPTASELRNVIDQRARDKFHAGRYRLDP